MVSRKSVHTAGIVGHERVPNVQRQTRTLDFRLRSLDVPPIGPLWDTARAAVVVLRCRVVCVDFAVGGGPWRDRSPGLPSELLQVAGAASRLVEDENDGEEEGETQDGCEGRTGHTGDLGQSMS